MLPVHVGHQTDRHIGILTIATDDNITCPVIVVAVGRKGRKIKDLPVIGLDVSLAGLLGELGIGVGDKELVCDQRHTELVRIRGAAPPYHRYGYPSIRLRG